MKMNTEQGYFQSATFNIYPKLGQVKVAGTTIRLGPVNMRVLMTLVENQGQVVSRAELFDSVWKNQVVSDDTLTRCISDLRTQLGQYTKQKLIETLPKRGYQWLPKVSPVVTVESKRTLLITKSHIYWFLALVTGLLILSTSALWVANLVVRPDQVRIALIPVQAKHDLHQQLASDMEDILRARVLKTSKLRFLSSSIFAKRPENHFPFLSREFNAQWVIEGRIRTFQNKIRASLNLVDARTALVIHSIVKDMDTESPDLDALCHTFVNDMLQLL